MEKLKELFPVLFSPQLWGAFVTVAFQYLKVKGWLGDAEANAISALFGLATFNGVALKAAKKIGNGSK